MEIVRPGSSQARYAAKSQQMTDLGEKKYRPLVRNFHARQPLTASGELYLIAVITTLHAGCQRRVRPYVVSAHIHLSAPDLGDTTRPGPPAGPPRPAGDRPAGQSKLARGALLPSGTRAGPDALGRMSMSKISVGR